jgi:hypothetical protein
MGVLEKLLMEASPALALVVCLSVVTYKLGALWITKYFDKVVPVQERGISALEKLAETGSRLADTSSHAVDLIMEDQKILFASIRGMNWEVERLRRADGSSQEQ